MSQMTTCYMCPRLATAFFSHAPAGVTVGACSEHAPRYLMEDNIRRLEMAFEAVERATIDRGVPQITLQFCFSDEYTCKQLQAEIELEWGGTLVLSSLPAGAIDEYCANWTMSVDEFSTRYGRITDILRRSIERQMGLSWGLSGLSQQSPL